MDSFVSSNDTHPLETDLPSDLLDERNLSVPSNFLQTAPSFYGLAHRSQSTTLTREISSYPFLLILLVTSLQS